MGIPPKRRMNRKTSSRRLVGSYSPVKSQANRLYSGAIEKSLPKGSRLNSPNISLLSARGIALLEAECLSRVCLKLQCV